VTSDLPDGTRFVAISVDVPISAGTSYTTTEPVALSVGPTEVSHTFSAQVRQVLALADGCDVTLEFDAPTTANSFKLPNKMWCIFARTCTKIYAKGSASGVLYLVGFR